ncbi:MAG: Na+/H+ antiporter NhaC family protein [Wenzhouxiangellaceae bacterium]|nr:Na+/H+ antiporter NhaC family protein [Wenzhouxiangellaceae bacterium]
MSRFPFLLAGLALALPSTGLAQAEAAAHDGWISLLPPLLAIALALALRQVLPALFAGIWIGAWAIADFEIGALFTSLFEVADDHVLGAMTEPDQAAVVLFTMLIGGMVGVISRNGGMHGIVERIVDFASTAQRAMATTVAMGLAIFFDDYANTLIVGNTMRPITDRLNVSREKLAYLVDSTAAPIACIALVTTWVGYEVGLVRDAIDAVDGLDLNAYLVFLNSIPYSFYPILALVLVFAVVATGRDFGPMREAERRARIEGRPAPATRASAATADEMAELQPEDTAPKRALNAVIPIVTLVGGVVVGMFVTGEGETLQEIVGDSNPYTALIWGSLAGSLVAIALSVAQRVLTLEASVAAWFAGTRSMLYAVLILILAWALSGVTETLGTAAYLESLIGDAMHVGFLPALVLVVAGLTAFATGSSWGTMGILLPLMVPLAWAMMTAQGMADEASLHVLYATVAAPMGGAVWGDHCSPISDTTILSSMASRCDHIEHVRTQLPYALLAGGFALVLGTLPAGFGWPWWLCLGISAAAMLAAFRWMARPVEEVAEGAAQSA